MHSGNKFIQHIRIFTIVAGSVLMAVACAPTKNAAYLRSMEEVETIHQPDQVYVIDRDSTYVIKPGDELYISVTSSDDEPNNFNAQQFFTDLDMLSNIVDEKGYIKVPYISRTEVAGKTLHEAEQEIERELAQYILDPVVTIRLVNIRVTVLGEVNRPGIFAYNNREINVFQALGYAGDISTYGNRENVLIIRHQNDTILKKYVDLTNDAIINTEWFLLSPNDIVYVEPLGRRKWGMETFPWDLIATTISTTILILTFLITLTN